MIIKNVLKSKKEKDIYVLLMLGESFNGNNIGIIIDGSPDLETPKVSNLEIDNVSLESYEEVSPYDVPAKVMDIMVKFLEGMVSIMIEEFLGHLTE